MGSGGFRISIGFILRVFFWVGDLGFRFSLLGGLEFFWGFRGLQGLGVHIGARGSTACGRWRKSCAI